MVAGTVFEKEMIRRLFLKRNFVFSLFVFLLGWVLFFSLHFNPENYRPQVEQYLKKSLPVDFELGPLSLSWKEGMLIFEAQSLALRSHSSHQVLLRSGKVTAPVRLLGLLGGHIIIDRLTMEDAYFSILRNGQREWNWNFLPNAKHKQKARLFAGWKVSMLSFQAPHAVIDYTDQSELPYFQQRWTAADILAIDWNSESGSLLIKSSESNLLRAIELKLLSSQSLVVKADFGPLGSGKGTVENFFQEAQFRGDLNLVNVGVETFPLFSSLSGTGSLRLSASGEGLHPESFKRNLILKGNANFGNGRMILRNFSKELLTSLSVIPGFSNLVRRPFAGKLEDFSRSSDTVFESLRADYALSNGMVFADSLQMEGRHFRIQCDGKFNLMENDLKIRGTYFFKNESSQALRDRTELMRVLMNSQGEVKIPFSYEGAWKNFKLAADLSYIVNRMVQMRSHEMSPREVQKLNQFLEAQSK